MLLLVGASAVHLADMDEARAVVQALEMAVPPAQVASTPLHLLPPAQARVAPALEAIGRHLAQLAATLAQLASTSTPPMVARLARMGSTPLGQPTHALTAQVVAIARPMAVPPSTHAPRAQAVAMGMELGAQAWEQVARAAQLGTGLPRGQTRATTVRLANTKCPMAVQTAVRDTTKTKHA